MRIPIIWLKDCLDTKKSPEEIADSFTRLGLMLDKPIKNKVLDLEHRGNRSDWVSILGCARDLAAYEKLKLKMPELHTQNGNTLKPENKIPITVKAKDAVNRFNTRVFKNIKVKESPQWLKKRLKAYGIEPKNNIVDITNFVMVELGQPMHAQDLAKFSKREITIRYAKNNETLTTILGEKVELDKDTFILTQNDEPIAIGGIVGSKKTSITKNTKEIILDAGNYNQKIIRDTSRRLNIQNETVLRYDKILNPRLTEQALNRATKLILELAGGEYYNNIDWYPQQTKPQTQHLTLSRLQQVTGMNFKLSKVKRILLDLGYEIIEQSPNSLTVEVPIFRTDIEVEDDLISDILRISGYDNIPSQKISKSPPEEITPKIYQFEQKLKDILIQIGLHEHITEPLIEKSSKKDEVILENALTSEKSALRTSLEQTLQKVPQTYYKHGINKVAIFEIGKTYHKKGKKSSLESYHEKRRLSAIYQNQNKNIEKESKKIRQILSSLLNSLGINYSLTKEGGKTVIQTDSDKLGILKPTGFTLETKKLLKHQQEKAQILSEFKHYQKEDVSFLIDSKKLLGPIYQAIKNSPKIKEVTIKEQYQGEEIPKNKKSFLLELTFGPKANTQKLKKELLNKLKEEFNIKPRTNT